jgi:hypothetical protein
MPIDVLGHQAKIRRHAPQQVARGGEHELLLNVLCHNIVCVIHEIHESGALPTFPALAGQTCPKRLKAAQQGLAFD